ncbi:unnamed protein product [Phaedon cochleariae]|uniref:Vacuolar ATP synthase subunit S1 n=1 Tax=Phaedon cochleariae TaxID=80249 RepID=A0A9N9SDV2_PHACE|nr:unnamed protein product [Phaedon cochleariae]
MKLESERIIFLVFLNIFYSNAAVFLWSNQHILISPLQSFTSEDFSKLIASLSDPEVYIFRSPVVLSDDFKVVKEGFYSTYNPNASLDPENVTDLTGDAEKDVEYILKVLSERKSDNILSVILIPEPGKRPKRQIVDGDNTTEQNDIEKSTKPIPKGPVIYRKQNINNNLYALLYSSKPLLLKRNDTEPLMLYLGNTDEDMITYDTRLNVIIPVKVGGKITLRFSFTWLNGYWYMSSVKIRDTETSRDYNLTTKEDINAPAHFSYHCNGYTLFSDSNGTELFIYDLQVQIDSQNGKFGDANDCVTFTTVPIWSGLFVTSILGLGFIVALTAMMDIKTMDKFDNHKTKNIAITVSE